jgi:GDP-L-fucose synthase
MNIQAHRAEYQDVEGLRGLCRQELNCQFDMMGAQLIEEARAHRKCVEAVRRVEDHVVCRGTGAVAQEFLHSDDCARGIALAAEKYDRSDPVNLGAGFEISIRDLAEKIAALTGFKGRLVWDALQPDGQPRRSLDTSRAEREFGFRARIGFDEGLKQTIEWYRNQVLGD